MNKILSFLVLALIVIIAVITNPDQSRHREVIKNELHEYLQEEVGGMSDSKSGLLKAGSALGMMIGGTIADKMVDNMVSTQNYLIFSISEITYNEKPAYIGFGAFGNVFLSPDFKEKLKKNVFNKKAFLKSLEEED